jgi:streptomycin 6-kinase
MDLRSRADARTRAWAVVIEDTRETPTSFLAFGHREGRPVVLKVLRAGGDEWRSGAVVDAFAGRGVVRVYEHQGGAVLLERVRPGERLVDRALEGRDGEATGILAEVIARMSPRDPPAGVPTVADWAGCFDRYAASGDRRIPADLLEAGRRIYRDLCDSHSRPRLLHGDLHHDNVLFDSDRGWLAIDPKGVVGEPEFEVGAALRNPHEAPDLFLDPATIERRIDSFATELGLDAGRILAWGFAQAVLSAVWSLEDGLPVEQDHPGLALARAMRPML